VLTRVDVVVSQTAAWERQGWSPVCAEAALPRRSPTDMNSSAASPPSGGGGGGIEGLAVVELSKPGGGICASTACALLADAGAAVLKLEPAGGGGDPWRQANPASFAQFNREPFTRFPRVYWVAVPQALRARRVNRWQGLAPARPGRGGRPGDRGAAAGRRRGVRDQPRVRRATGAGDAPGCAAPPVPGAGGGGRVGVGVGAPEWARRREGGLLCVCVSGG
jgi:hypothetical protein